MASSDIFLWACVYFSSTNILPFFAFLQLIKLQQWHLGKSDSNLIPMPRNKCMRVVYKVCMHTAFDIILQIFIFINVITIIVELVEESKMCSAELDARYGNLFNIFNYVFIVIYTIECVLKVNNYAFIYFLFKICNGGIRSWKLWFIASFVCVIICALTHANCSQ